MSNKLEIYLKEYNRKTLITSFIKTLLAYNVEVLKFQLARYRGPGTVVKSEARV